MKLSYLNRSMRLLMTLLLFASGLPSTVWADQEQQCRLEIHDLLSDYQRALNDSATGDIVPLYSDDGIFMPSNKPTAVGGEQVKTAYQHVFKALDLNVEFHIDEIERHGEIAFVRTTSDGEIKLLEKDITIKNNSRELFILKRIDGVWKIYRYMFNEMS
ncbi:MAG TPA: nuclear transport factor 2 family protein [Gammaproteobacteria bacterium]|nr:nuclear transport factor 2 family protein [Gammaproteobacteria bacterium]